MTLALAACGGSSIDSAPEDAGVDARTTGPDGGTTRRPTEVTCPSARPAGNADPSADGSCKHDSDCTDGTNGRCVTRLPFGNACSYDACTSDDDCGAGQVCDCRNASYEGANVCFHGNCRVDADCASGEGCSPSGTEIPASCTGAPPGSIGYFCRSPNDTCASDSDCTATDGAPYCVFVAESGHWGCISVQCTF